MITFGQITTLAHVSEGNAMLLDTTVSILIEEAKKKGPYAVLQLSQELSRYAADAYRAYEAMPVEVQNHCITCNRDWAVMVPEKEERDCCGIDHCPKCWNETESGKKYGPSRHTATFRYLDGAQ